MQFRNQNFILVIFSIPFLFPNFLPISSLYPTAKWATPTPANRFGRVLLASQSGGRRTTAGMVFIAGKTVSSMPERLKVVCIPCKALYKCSAFFNNICSQQTCSLGFKFTRNAFCKAFFVYLEPRQCVCRLQMSFYFG